MSRQQQSTSSRLNQMGVRERRAQPRSTVVTKAQIINVPADGTPGSDTRAVVLADISLSGVGLHCIQPLTVGSRWRVQVSAGPMQLGATIEVMNCRRRDGGFIAGARFV